MVLEAYKYFLFYKMNKKAQSTTISGLIFGVATLIVGVIIAFVIVSNVGSIDDEIYTTVEGGTVVNETVTGFNETVGDVLAKFGTVNGVQCTGIAVLNASNNVPIPTANWSITASTCNLLGLNSNEYLGYNVKATYLWTYRATSEASSNMQGNFSGAVDNVSKYIPTVLLVMAIVLILSILGVLVVVWQRMRMGGGGGI